MKKRKQHELVGFVAIWAVQYQKDYGLDGLHPTHYDLIKKYGGRMDSFKRATKVTSAPAAETCICGVPGCNRYPRSPQEGAVPHD